MRYSIWTATDPLSGYNPIFEEEHYIDFEHNLGVLNSFNHATYSYCYQNPINLFDPNGKQSKAWNRTMGALQGIGGVVEIVGSGVGEWFSGGTATPLMAPLFLNGVDNTQAGFRQLWTGETTETMLHKGVKTTAKALGASDLTAENIATGADFATILIGNGAAIKSFNVKKAVQKLCFIAGTKIASKDGLIVIEDIQIGDEVWTFNELTGEVEIQKVVSLFQNTSSELVEITVGNKKNCLYTRASVLCRQQLG